MDKHTVIHRLARELSNEVLREIFPRTSPDTIRNLLLEGTDKSPRNTPSTSGEKGASLVDCRLYTDGASRGNPGQAGAGVVLLDDRGEEILAKSAYLGVCTNNFAEYRALIFGLESAGEMGCRNVSIFLDSELIVRQVQGSYKVKNADLKPLYNEVQNLLQRFERVTITHIPRAKNARADELANRGIDEKQYISQTDTY